MTSDVDLDLLPIKDLMSLIAKEPGFRAIVIVGYFELGPNMRRTHVAMNGTPQFLLGTVFSALTQMALRFQFHAPTLRLDEMRAFLRRHPDAGIIAVEGDNNLVFCGHGQMERVIGMFIEALTDAVLHRERPEIDLDEDNP
jgi:hypothetical protein